MPGPTVFELYEDQQDVEYTDLNTDNIAPVDLMAAFIAALTNTNNMSTATPLEMILSGSARQGLIGGAGQSVICQGYLCDSCAAQTLSILPNTTGSVRTDLIQIQYVQSQGNPHSAGFYGGGSATVYSAYQSAVYGIKTGSTTPDSGWVAFAHLAVPNGFTVGTACTLTYLFPTLSSQLIAGGIVQSINGHSGALTLQNSDGSIVITYSGGVFTISAPNNGVASLNSETGALSIVAGSGTTVSKPSGSTIAVNVVEPLGTVHVAQQTFTDTGSPVTATLASLPGSGNVYFVEAFVFGFGLDGGDASKVATLTGTAATWPGTPATVDGTAYSRTLYLAGTAYSGHAPSVTFSSNENKMLEGGGTGYVVLKAIRIS
jgi:hypothetical protein